MRPFVVAKYAFYVSSLVENSKRSLAPPLRVRPAPPGSPAVLQKKYWSQGRKTKKKATRLGGFLYKQINLIISWRTGGRDVRP